MIGAEKADSTGNAVGKTYDPISLPWVGCMLPRLVGGTCQLTAWMQKQGSCAFLFAPADVNGHASGSTVLRTGLLKKSLLENAAMPGGNGCDLARRAATPSKVKGSGMVTALVSVTAATSTSMAEGGDIVAVRKVDWVVVEWSGFARGHSGREDSVDARRSRRRVWQKVMIEESSLAANFRGTDDLKYQTRAEGMTRVTTKVGLNTRTHQPEKRAGDVTNTSEDLSDH